jgi:hypothetical protein
VHPRQRGEQPRLALLVDRGALGRQPLGQVVHEQADRAVLDRVGAVRAGERFPDRGQDRLGE